MKLSKETTDILVGDPFGQVFPPREPPPPLPVDARTIALRVLARYLSEITFFRPGGKDERTGVEKPPAAYQVPYQDIHIEQPDYPEKLSFPSFVMIAVTKADYDAIGLTSYVLEDSRDVFGMGTVLQQQSEYQETFALEIWANKKAERRSLLAGLETVLTPTEQLAGIRFRLRDYYNQTVCFAIVSREIFDEPDATRGRRRARLMIEMRVNLVALVNYVGFQPELLTQLDADAQTGEAIELDDEEPPDPRPLNLPRTPAGGCCTD